jgi:hypothetical protein
MMMELSNGVACIKGEIHATITLIRLNTRWSSRYLRKSGRDGGLFEEEDVFIQKFRNLNEYLEGLFELEDVDCVKYITPFHDLVVSDQVSGTLTRAALSSLNKFCLYGFFQPEFPRIEEAMALVGKSVSHCVFEETDWESDELILMKLLELATSSFRCNASHLLTAETAWDIYSTCVSIHSHYRASKILRTEAETALVHLTLSIFSKTSAMIAKTGHFFAEEIKEKDFYSKEIEKNLAKIKLESPVGITIILLKITKVINDLLDLPKQQKAGIKFGLFLTNVALEAGGTSLNTVLPLVNVLRNDICRHLLRCTQSEDLGIFSSSLRVVFNLFMSIKEHIKIQLEVFLTSVHFRLLNPASTSMNASIVPAKEELILESLIEFCREPLLMHDLYTNYDCDVQCTNLFDTIITILSQRSVLGLSTEFFPNPDNNTSSATENRSGNYNSGGVAEATRLSILHRLAFEGLYAILHSMTTKLNDLVQIDSLDCSDSNKQGPGGISDPRNLLENEIDKWCEAQTDAELLLGEENDENSVNTFNSPVKDEIQDVSKKDQNRPQQQSGKNIPLDSWIRLSNKGNEQNSLTGSESDHSDSNPNPSLIDRENELTTNSILGEGKSSHNTDVRRFKLIYLISLTFSLL